MENKIPDFVPYYMHEMEIARCEQKTRHWMIACLVVFVALVLTNIF